MRQTLTTFQRSATAMEYSNGACVHPPMAADLQAPNRRKNRTRRDCSRFPAKGSLGIWWYNIGWASLYKQPINAETAAIVDIRVKLVSKSPHRKD